jgi:hypothetical protein
VTHAQNPHSRRIAPLTHGSNPTALGIIPRSGSNPRDPWQTSYGLESARWWFLKFASSLGFAKLANGGAWQNSLLAGSLLAGNGEMVPAASDRREFSQRRGFCHGSPRSQSAVATLVALGLNPSPRVLSRKLPETFFSLPGNIPSLAANRFKRRVCHRFTVTNSRWLDVNRDSLLTRFCCLPSENQKSFFQRLADGTLRLV